MLANGVKNVTVNQVSNDKGVFNAPDCECRELWRKVVGLDELTYGAPIVK